MNKLKITIITVTLNCRETILSTIDSIKKQSLLPFEYIFIDGSSTDGTLDIIKKEIILLEKQGILTTLISEKDSGIFDAMNKGIKKANGEIIGILNSGDEYVENTLELINNFLKINSNVEVIHGNMLIKYRKNGSDDTYVQYPRPIKGIFTEMVINHPTVFVKKEVYQRIGLYSIDLKYSADWEFLIKAKLSNISINYINEILTKFDYDGFSSKPNINHVMERFSIRKQHISNKVYLFYQTLSDFLVLMMSLIMIRVISADKFNVIKLKLRELKYFIKGV